MEENKVQKLDRNRSINHLTQLNEEIPKSSHLNGSSEKTSKANSANTNHSTDKSTEIKFQSITEKTLKQSSETILDFSPITQQPMVNFNVSIKGVSCLDYSESIIWMPKFSEVATSASCTPGLECLSQLDQVLIHPIIDKLELLSATIQSKYDIKNKDGQMIFKGIEDISASLIRYSGYDCIAIDLYDCYQTKVLRISRTTSDNLCFATNFYNLNIISPPENIIGGLSHQINTELLKEIIHNGNNVGNITKQTPENGNLVGNVEVNCKFICG
ncbi:uncharacterized protein TRIADDRAFT_56036 [Trichoplax adhaerens]|uniref:Phospholipid scramblase n=1 Tax=Trichoplax adhaerens TaxID=10228 RepID=B3RTT1_TRIAD|nr:predicted protein [Trichoplax adhaerens]EDV26190.1 predicted protein [Trichoplax adhaerens]|eukprot:XP_002112223.1 predicted protein [Trichoplax adhaerens]